MMLRDFILKKSQQCRISTTVSVSDFHSENVSSILILCSNILRGRAEVARQAQYRVIHCDEFDVYVDEWKSRFPSILRDSGISSSKGSSPFIDTNLKVGGSNPPPATNMRGQQAVNLLIDFSIGQSNFHKYYISVSQALT